MTVSDPSLLPAVAAAIHEVLQDTGRQARTIEPTMLLTVDLGLDSLDLAQTIVLLERSLGVDPFRTPPASGIRPTIRTVADLVSLYAPLPAVTPPIGPPGAPDRGLPSHNP